ncbi:MAG TPA: magnesium transporter CorA family protein [Candidatus Merdivicinus faecavium]|nr:magnesium transporter CorA family protein [Candidatus Merdivicinus faecavium]
MLKFFKTIDGKIEQIKREEPGCWVMAVHPTAEELQYMRTAMELDSDFLSASLDEEEISRTEKEEDQTFVVVDVPYQVDKDEEDEEEDKSVVFTTIPLGIIITPDYFVTISSKQSAVLDNIASGLIRGIQTRLHTRFLLTILLRIAQRFLVHLRQIEKISSSMESQMHSETKNAALIQLMGLQKSLVYISSSLRSNEATLKRISRGNLLTLYEEDEDLMQDVLIEIHQAMEMSEIYSNVLASTMEAYASIISNNLNTVMKVQASATILLTIPTIVFSYYGMNVSGLQYPIWWFPTLVSLILMLVAMGVLLKFKMFK